MYTHFQDKCPKDRALLIYKRIKYSGFDLNFWYCPKCDVFYTDNISLPSQLSETQITVKYNQYFELAHRFRAVKKRFKNSSSLLDQSSQDLTGSDFPPWQSLYYIEPKADSCPVDKTKLQKIFYYLPSKNGGRHLTPIHFCPKCKYVFIEFTSENLSKKLARDISFLPTKESKKIRIPERDSPHTELPKSQNNRILKVKSSEDGTTYTIVTNVKDCDTESHFLLAERGQAKRIMNNVLFEKQSSYVIVEEYPSFQQFKHFCENETAKGIYIYSSKYDFHGKCESVTALVLFENHPYAIPINVFYDSRRDIYFMNERDYAFYRQKYGLPFLQIVRYEPNSYYHTDFSDLNAASALKLYGYNVSGTSKYSDQERLQLLQSIIDNGFLTKSQIISHLDWLLTIQKNNPSFRDACWKWRHDRFHIYDYQMDTQRSIWAKHFIPYNQK